jgi:diacylglycerol kinase family enzyme
VTLPVLNRSTPFFIVFNASSGSGDKQKNREDMARILTEANQPHEFFLIKRPEQIDDLAKQAAAAAAKHQGAVIVAGGDGTINAVAEATLPTQRPFGLVPQGTFNYSGRAHSIPLETIPATQALLSGRIKPIQVGRVNERIFLVNASLGLYPQLLEDREEYKQQYGRKRAVAFWAGLMTLVRYRGQLVLEMEHENKRESVLTPTLFVGNNPLQLQQVGVPQVEAVQDQRRLAAIVVRPTSRVAMLWLAVRGALGNLGEADNVRHFSFASMTVQPKRGSSSRGVKVATDGEICWMRGPLRFTVAPQPLMLIVPADAPEGLPEKDG